MDLQNLHVTVLHAQGHVRDYYDVVFKHAESALPRNVSIDTRPFLHSFFRGRGLGTRLFYCHMTTDP